MQIPSKAIIPEDKLTRYLLVFRDKDDKSKFLAQAGFTLDNVTSLQKAIIQLITAEDASKMVKMNRVSFIELKEC
ncbi:DUF6883 domain-containing protein [Microcystis aeruginosa]|jgi:hypothetical protein|uniref:DUF6883 domain-containing protein n=1 Tax=Microcystis aeruginosa Sj TaxID=1979544 RepID=A0A2Z6UXQ8_MICAE|nr:DUF6883 domain-containing protein [Microcystis aeruginosa]MDB9431877.1 hypothetical protein [Microcystis aeruginosa CS-552/01]GBL12666.1 hypothetical protein MSj_04186 [Microcystis aeruginosa Sj]